MDQETRPYSLLPIPHSLLPIPQFNWLSLRRSGRLLLENG